jgi:hypothetical protein
VRDGIGIPSGNLPVWKNIPKNTVRTFLGRVFGVQEGQKITLPKILEAVHIRF